MCLLFFIYIFFCYVCVSVEMRAWEGVGVDICSDVSVDLRSAVGGGGGGGRCVCVGGGVRILFSMMVGGGGVGQRKPKSVGGS